MESPAGSPQQLKKLAVAKAALKYVQPGTVLGIGTGSTVDCFIDELKAFAGKLKTVSSSVRSTQRLQKHGVEVLELNAVGGLSIYVDGADETNRAKQMIKGGGGAQTREKIVAAAAERFVCIVDESKVVDVLGKFPLPIEVIPMARELVARQLVKLGGRPVLRQGFTTDDGNPILDVHDLKITDPLAMEQEINQWAGVVTVGLFARRPADVLLIAGDDGIREL